MGIPPPLSLQKHIYATLVHSTALLKPSNMTTLWYRGGLREVLNWTANIPRSVILTGGINILCSYMLITFIDNCIIYELAKLVILVRTVELIILLSYNFLCNRFFLFLFIFLFLFRLIWRSCTSDLINIVDRRNLRAGEEVLIIIFACRLFWLKSAHKWSIWNFWEGEGPDNFFGNSYLKISFLLRTIQCYILDNLMLYIIFGLIRFG